MRIQVAEADTGSGLLIAEQATDREAVAALLKRHDPSLRLIPQMGGAGFGVLWTVYSWNGPDRPADFVCAWQTADGDPLPLSSRLLEKVQQLDKRTVGKGPDPDVENARHVAAVRRDRRNAYDSIADDHRPYVDRGRLSVSMSDAKNPKPARQRTRLPKRAA